MSVLVYFWLQSVRFIFSWNIISLGMASCKRFFSAITKTATLFWWLFLVDMVLFVATGIQIDNAKYDQGMSMGSALLHLLIGITWFILRASFFLFVRYQERPSSISHIAYFKRFFVKYMRLCMMSLLALLILTTFLLSLGITQFPPFTSVFVLALQIIQFLMVFFWLDLPGRLKDYGASLERSINFFVYNLPLFLLLILVICGFEYGITSIEQLRVAFFGKEIVTLASYGTIKNLLAYAGIRYVRVVFELGIISTIYAIYEPKKGIIYAHRWFT